VSLPRNALDLQDRRDPTSIPLSPQTVTGSAGPISLATHLRVVVTKTITTRAVTKTRTRSRTASTIKRTRTRSRMTRTTSGTTRTMTRTTRTRTRTRRTSTRTSTTTTSTSTSTSTTRTRTTTKKRAKMKRKMRTTVIMGSRVRFPPFISYLILLLTDFTTPAPSTYDRSPVSTAMHVASPPRAFFPFLLHLFNIYIITSFSPLQPPEPVPSQALDLLLSLRLSPVPAPCKTVRFSLFIYLFYINYCSCQQPPAVSAAPCTCVSHFFYI
jgi:hypothetical protein